MLSRKTPEANLENKRGAWKAIGFVASLSLLLSALAWTSYDVAITRAIDFEADLLEDEEIPVNVVQPPPPPPPPQQTTVIEIVDDEEEIEESISGIFNILGNALASKSGRVDVMDILTHGSSTESHSQKSRQDARSSIHRWMHDTNAYEQTVSDRWANAFDVQESEQAWIEAVQATRVRKEG